MIEEGKEVRTKLLVDVSSEMEDVPENDGETIRYCIEQDLENQGYEVYSCEVLNKDGLDKDTLQKIIDRLTENIDKYQDELNKLMADNQVNSMEELRQNTKINGIRIAREIICKMYREKWTD